MTRKERSMIRNIMVPLDGSALAGLAVEPAAALAAHHHARLLIVTAHEQLAPTEALNRADLDALRAHLDEVRARTAEKWPISVETLMLDGGGRVAERLAEAALAQGVDFIVMTTHGRGAAGRAWFGSVADHLVRAAHCPVLLIRKPDDESRTGFRRILIPLDGTPHAEAALADARILAAAGSEFLLVRVVVPVIAFGPTPGGGVVLSGGVLEDQRREAEVYAQKLAAQLAAEGYGARGLAVIDTSPAAAILEAAEEQRPDVIVMSGIRRSGADRFLLGSVMDKVVRQASVPVLIRRSSP
jgi:nucleotide-binding universal stress UspA family protein